MLPQLEKDCNKKLRKHEYFFALADCLPPAKSVPRTFRKFIPRGKTDSHPFGKFWGIAPENIVRNAMLDLVSNYAIIGFSIYSFTKWEALI